MDSVATANDDCHRWYLNLLLVQVELRVTTSTSRLDAAMIGDPAFVL
jgi:hypothetical protein